VRANKSAFWYPSFRRLGTVAQGQVNLRINFLNKPAVELELLRQGVKKNWIIKRATLITKHEQIDFQPPLRRIPYLTAVPLEVSHVPIPGLIKIEEERVVIDEKTGRPL